MLYCILEYQSWRNTNALIWGELQKFGANLNDVFNFSNTGLQGLSSLNIVKERGQMTMEHTQQCWPDIVDTTIHEMQEDFTIERSVPEQDLRCGTMGATAGITPQREEEELEQTGGSIWKVRVQNLLRKVELLKESEPSADQVQDCENPQSTLRGADQAMLSLQLRHKPGPREEGLSTVASSSTCNYLARLAHHRTFCM